VLDEGGFTGAADRLGVSQPAVSQSVGALERELGVELFHRLGRGVRPSDAGRALVAPARLALRDVAAAREAVAGVLGLEQGQLELACLPTLAAAPLAALVGAFRERHPGVTIRLLDPDDSADLVDLVRTGRCELGLTGPTPLDDLVATPLGHQEFRAVLPPGRVRAEVLTLDELATMPMVAPPRGSSSRDLLDSVLAERGLSPTIVVEAAQREAVLPLVRAGAGAALVPLALAEAGRRLGCDVARFEPPLGRPVVLVHRAAGLSPAAAAFASLAVDAEARGDG
jgi:DNA-binding transcriptional LysR family regulator